MGNESLWEKKKAQSGTKSFFIYKGSKEEKNSFLNKTCNNVLYKQRWNEVKETLKEKEILEEPKKKTIIAESQTVIEGDKSQIADKNIFKQKPKEKNIKDPITQKTVKKESEEIEGVKGIITINKKPKEAKQRKADNNKNLQIEGKTEVEEKTEEKTEKKTEEGKGQIQSRIKAIIKETSNSTKKGDSNKKKQNRKKNKKEKKTPIVVQNTDSQINHIEIDKQEKAKKEEGQVANSTHSSINTHSEKYKIGSEGNYKGSSNNSDSNIANVNRPTNFSLIPPLTSYTPPFISNNSLFDNRANIPNFQNNLTNNYGIYNLFKSPFAIDNHFTNSRYHNFSPYNTLNMMPNQNFRAPIIAAPFSSPFSSPFLQQFPFTNNHHLRAGVINSFSPFANNCYGVGIYGNNQFQNFNPSVGLNNWANRMQQQRTLAQMMTNNNQNISIF